MATWEFTGRLTRRLIPLARQGARPCTASNLVRYSWLGLFLVGLLAAAAWSQAPSPAELRARSTKLMNDGNFKDAYDGFRKLCLDPKTEAGQVART